MGGIYTLWKQFPRGSSYICCGCTQIYNATYTVRRFDFEIILFVATHTSLLKRPDESLWWLYRRRSTLEFGRYRHLLLRNLYLLTTYLITLSNHLFLHYMNCAVGTKSLNGLRFNRSVMGASILTCLWRSMFYRRDWQGEWHSDIHFLRYSS
jgi:hypothetical protein